MILLIKIHWRQLEILSYSIGSTVNYVSTIFCFSSWLFGAKSMI